jgi:hypothetical protein
MVARIRGTDQNAVDVVKGAGNEKAFNLFPTANGDRQINASSKADLMKQIGGIRKSASAMGGIAITEESISERNSALKEAYNDPDMLKKTGEVFSDTVWETLGQVTAHLN